MDLLDLVGKKILDARGQKPREVRIGRQPGLRGFKAGDLVGRVNGIPIRFDPQVKKGVAMAHYGDNWTQVFL